MSPTPENEPVAEPQDASAAETAAEPASAARPARKPAPHKPAARLIFDDPLNQQSSDDTDRGWGERPSGGDSAADLARFLDEKPPHHL
ncbi:hypothetical protein [Streptomyces auratus]|uniref:Uncharacterized protein n=1 Tax=Streptomyces auratus AGR0001 TaxID=1160718 RepID=A0A8B1NN41_9ACTN|nr:hypothetical protein [Streptomyces auratus]QTZ92427.1 hypothetical protein SU9_013815 [Streptomyces auratus AGR0001]